MLSRFTGPARSTLRRLATVASDPLPSFGPNERGGDDVRLSDRCAKEIARLLARPGYADSALRLLVDGGGCNGFKYEFGIERDPPSPKDRVFERQGARMVVDKMSMLFVRGSLIDYEDTMMRAAFVVRDNPQVSSKCGCGTSFSSNVAPTNMEPLIEGHD